MLGKIPFQWLTVTIPSFVSITQSGSAPVETKVLAELSAVAGFAEVAGNSVRSGEFGVCLALDAAFFREASRLTFGCADDMFSL